MSTRGFLGFVIDGVEKITYNHSDSYPRRLGRDVLSWAQANQHALTCACDIHRCLSSGPVDRARTLRVVDPDSEPTDEDIERLRYGLDLGVGIRRARPDWYQLLRRTQGDLAAMLAAGVIEDGSDFPADSLSAEWGYIVDLDRQVLEVYEGFQKAAHTAGRFAARTSSDASPGYYPVRLVASWPLSELPTPEEFIAEIGRDAS